MGEQSVSAIMPKRVFVVSGASLAYTPPTQALGKAANRLIAAEVLTVRPKNWRRLRAGEDPCAFDLRVLMEWRNQLQDFPG
jgi:hypothetical protein